MTADEMFEKLRYEKTDNNAYIKFIETRENLDTIYISFDNKEIWIKDDVDIVSITTADLQAINQKCKELGWIE